MTLADVAAARAIEQGAYPSPPKRDFAHELAYNRLAHYLLLWHQAGPPLAVGLAGYWLIASEAHIITIAVLPAWQRRALGEYLLLGLLQDAQSRQAEVATLEVRRSNSPAIALYQKYQFELVGHRPGYYDNGEDALILTTPPLASPGYQALLTENEQVLLRRLSQTDVDKNGPLD
ncbi:MAG: ribosomal protein S18-alanine N-acetyltransferase [Anaerolineae bacterium]